MFQKQPKIITVDTLLSLGKLDSLNSKKESPFKTNIIEDIPIKENTVSEVVIIEEPVIQPKPSEEISKPESVNETALDKKDPYDDIRNFKMRGADILWIGDNVCM